MAYFVIPTKKQWGESQKKHGSPNNYDEVFDERFTCDICGKRLKANDRYFVVRTDSQVKEEGKPAFRHILCDEDFLKS